MTLTEQELQNLVELKEREPHRLLGLHALADGSGLVGRAFVPDAAKVEIQSLGDKTAPALKLTRLHKSGIFEGTTTEAKVVFPYELIITDQEGRVRRERDAYSFLPTLGESDLYLFGKGDERRIYDKLGAQLRTIDGVSGASFAVWAPNAKRISVVGDFNQWNGTRRHQMRPLGSSGVWEIFIPGVAEGLIYKYEVYDNNSKVRLKTDPFGFYFETPPKNASIVWNNQKFKWTDDAWLKRRKESNPLRDPVSIYELHIGCWRKKSKAESLSYRELAGPLIAYVKEMGFTHVEFMPVAEHAFYPSWGYQVTGFYAPTSRYGAPEDFQFLVNALHEAGIGVVVDWVPAHFPRDDWALARFDGTALFEHEDPRKGAHQDWGTLIFNYGRHEVVNFLIANALFWCERFHIDGLRVDAVASMLYLDYSRKSGEWIPNQFGRENLEAIDFIRQFNHLVHTQFPGVMTVAEESTAWPQVTRPPYLGGLGFSFKWNMGWMHDTLSYFSHEPVHRKYHQNDLTFAMLYHNHENFILPLSHDEVVHGKGSLLGRMPGDDWQRFANLRALLGYQWLFPGKKLLFMGGEFGQSGEWNANAELDWWLLKAGPYHAGVQKMVADLNKLYLAEPGLWKTDYAPEGFQWIDASDHANSILSFIRRDLDPFSEVVVILNLTPVPRPRYRIGLPRAGRWLEVLNSDSAHYGGSNMGNAGGVFAEEKRMHGQPASADFILPPLSIMAFRPEKPPGMEVKKVEAVPEQVGSLSSLSSPRRRGEGMAPASAGAQPSSGAGEKKPASPGTEKVV